MLVLARRPEEKILFPSLGITIEILRVTGQVVRVGVQAPRHVPVVRAELKQAGQRGRPPQTMEEGGTTDHHWRGRLNTAMMALYVAQKQLEQGTGADANQTLQRAVDELGRLERELRDRKKGESPPTPRPIKALVVEDNANEGALLGSYLQMSGVVVERATDGADALDFLQTHELPDAVLLDMRMPRCDGPTTLGAIRRNPAYAGVKVFGVSGATPSEYGLPVGGTGVDGWFTKPLNPAHIVQTLTEAVSRV